MFHDLAYSWLDLRSATLSSAPILQSAWACEYYDIMFWVISPYSKLKVQDGLPTESLWLMSYASIISDSDVEVEAQVQEPEQGDASGDIWCLKALISREHLCICLESILGSEILYFGNFWCILDLL